MRSSRQEMRGSPDCCRNARGEWGVLVAVLCLMGGGCAAWTNPVANGIPVCRVPPELLAGPIRDEKQTIPLTLLQQPPTKVYRLAAGDVLGIYIEGILRVASASVQNVCGPESAAGCGPPLAWREG